MFGLPLGTTLLVFGFPLFWILYMLVFMYVSRNWDRDSMQEDDAS
jgi:uncharacterized membrane protein